MHEVTHIGKGVVVIEHFDDPALHGFEPKTPDEAEPATAAAPDAAAPVATDSRETKDGDVA